MPIGQEKQHPLSIEMIKCYKPNFHKQKETLFWAGEKKSISKKL